MAGTRYRPSDYLRHSSDNRTRSSHLLVNTDQFRNRTTQKKNKKKKKKQVLGPDSPDPYFKRTGVFPFLKLPLEIQQLTIPQLHPITSACLGVTCKHLYYQHRRLHGNVHLRTRSPAQRVGHLAYLLEEWMLPRVFRFGKMYYTNARYQELARLEEVRKIKWQRCKDKRAKYTQEGKEKSERKALKKTEKAKKKALSFEENFMKERAETEKSREQGEHIES